jgi:hypothetical protein
LSADRLARNTPAPYSPAAVRPTVRGPTLAIQRPPNTAARPRKKIDGVKVTVTWEMDQPNSLVSGIRNTLQA